MKLFTVISFDSGNGQVRSDVVHAVDGLAAFSAAAKLRPSYFNFVVAIEGDHQEGQSATFAGECYVDGETILDQPGA